VNQNTRKITESNKRIDDLFYHRLWIKKLRNYEGFKAYEEDFKIAVEALDRIATKVNEKFGLDRIV